MPIFCVKSVKKLHRPKFFYTGIPVAPVTNIRYAWIYWCADRAWCYRTGRHKSDCPLSSLTATSINLKVSDSIYKLFHWLYLLILVWWLFWSFKFNKTVSNTLSNSQWVLNIQEINVQLVWFIWLSPANFFVNSEHKWIYPRKKQFNFFFRFLQVHIKPQT